MQFLKDFALHMGSEKHPNFPTTVSCSVVPFSELKFRCVVELDETSFCSEILFQDMLDKL